MDGWMCMDGLMDVQVRGKAWATVNPQGAETHGNQV